MSETKACCCGAKNDLIFACSGASNVGQLANGVAQQLAKNGEGSMSCIAAIGAHLDGFVVSARDCDQLIVLDGCERNCALLTFQQVEVKPHVHLTFTDQGFEKKHGEGTSEAELRRAYDLVIEKMKANACLKNS